MSRTIDYILFQLFNQNKSGRQTISNKPTSIYYPLEALGR